MKHKLTILAVVVAMVLVAGFSVSNACTNYPNPTNYVMTTNGMANDVSPPQTNPTTLVCDASGTNAVMTANLQKNLVAINESPPAVCAVGMYDYNATIDATTAGANSMNVAPATITDETNYAYMNTGPYGAPRKITSTSCVYMEAGTVWAIAWDEATENVELTWSAARDCVMASNSGNFGAGNIESTARDAVKDKVIWQSDLLVGGIRASPVTTVAMVLLKTTNSRGAPAVALKMILGPNAGMKSVLNC